ncbi:MAG: MoxR family ATPase, partial [candidate division WOR-3 bacterium]|nr:MoxR family ATPase [candidate division WOR-3 bacterium]
PIELEGTYPLPEAQLDRFMFEIVIDYPQPDEEVRIVETTTSAYMNEINLVIGRNEILGLQNLVRRVPVSNSLMRNVVKVIGFTRPSNNSEVPKFIREWVTWGASPRASQYVVLGAKAKALLDGRTTPSMADVRFVLKPVLRHRLILNFAAEAESVTTGDVIEKLMKEVM